VDTSKRHECDSDPTSMLQSAPIPDHIHHEDKCHKHATITSRHIKSVSCNHMQQGRGQKILSADVLTSHHSQSHTSSIQHVSSSRGGFRHVRPNKRHQICFETAENHLCMQSGNHVTRNGYGIHV